MLQFGNIRIGLKIKLKVFIRYANKSWFMTCYYSSGTLSEIILASFNRLEPETIRDQKIISEQIQLKALVFRFVHGGRYYCTSYEGNQISKRLLWSPTAELLQWLSFVVVIGSEYFPPLF